MYISKINSMKQAETDAQDQEVELDDSSISDADSSDDEQLFNPTSN